VVYAVAQAQQFERGLGSAGADGGSPCSTVTIMQRWHMHNAASDRAAAHTAYRADELPVGYQEPSFASRAFARLVDSLCFVPITVLLAVVVSDRGFAGLAYGVLFGMYEVGMTLWRGQTLGKMLLRLRVVDRVTGRRISPFQSLTRWAIWALPAIVGGLVSPLSGVLSFVTLIVFLAALRPPLHQGLHDMAAKTVVTKVDPQAR
jgi:uncharacterized RDD family membrane protein YckC